MKMKFGDFTFGLLHALVLLLLSQSSLALPERKQSHRKGQEVKQSCSAYPDPHFRTWQDVAYDFHDGCDVIFVRSERVEIHFRLKKNGSWSSIQNVAVKISTADASQEDVLEAKNIPGYNQGWNFYINDSNLTTPYDEVNLPNRTEIGGFPLDVYNPTGGFNNVVQTLRLTLPSMEGFIEITKLGYYGFSVIVEGSGEEFSEIFSNSDGMCSNFTVPGMFDREGNTIPFSPAFYWWLLIFPEMGQEWQVQHESPGTDSKLLSDINSFPLSGHNAYPGRRCNGDSISPTVSPAPTNIPSINPTSPAFSRITEIPSRLPSGYPITSPEPSATTIHPSEMPSTMPSDSPTMIPTMIPTEMPSEAPSDIPTAVPSDIPSTSECEFCQNLWDPIMIANCDFDASMLGCDAMTTNITIYNPIFSNYFATPFPDTEIDCVNDNDYFFSSVVAGDSNGEKKKTCRWIRMKEKRRNKYCEYQTVRINCPLSCGVCCEDDEDYTFDISFEKDGNKTKDCAWLARKERRQEKWCGENDDGDAFKEWQHGRMIRDACPKACNYCVD